MPIKTQVPSFVRPEADCFGDMSDHRRRSLGWRAFIRSPAARANRPRQANPLGRASDAVKEQRNRAACIECGF
jgi:hypothetical protein